MHLIYICIVRNALAPLAPETPISGRTVTTPRPDWSSPRHNFDTEQPSPQLTPARRSSKWDAAERHQSSRRPPHEQLSGPGRIAAPESVFSQPPLPEVIGEALTVCRPEEHVVVKVARCGSAAGAPDQEVVGREASASAGSTSTSVNGLELTMCSASAEVWRTSSRGLLSLNVAANAVLTDRTKRSQAPPMFGAPGV
ncbi:hypothetical protein EVAR_26756_1 [Eumeta japonica]|uniref:Uncharacterized protein n=1 Tax=Eumeta variegata TaxID=151549 RepID=A0A4C1XBS2_EUMVA|nr:hypothetical protein EVAR_26756_1 [Eumeta japonica]